MDATPALPELPVLPFVTKPAAPSGPPVSGGVRTMIDDFLAEQAATTAVERFAQRDVGRGEHVQAGRYRDLLPATPPGPGQQYAFDVDLDACSGCKACVAACHALNGLDEGEAWRDVGVLIGTGALPLVQPVPTGCHHCAEPGCLDGCPVDAYEKDPVTGIVSHLDDQCIGCRYCTLTCPYEVPQYSTELGIVRKCDLCADRLGAGEAPACVQACPTEAISIRVVDLEDVAAGDPWPFAAPDAGLTRPATRFRSSRDLTTEVEAADLHAVAPRHAHLPLTVMLVLTQAAVGAYAAVQAVDLAGALPAAARLPGALASLAIALVALAASVLHLGRPLLAWRAVIGLAHSWLSREIVAFSAFAGLAASAAADTAGWVDLPGGEWPGPLAAVTGLAAVGTSAMVYAVTGRPLWVTRRTVPRFALTVAGPGVGTAVAVLAAVGAVTAQTALATPVGAGAVVAVGALVAALVSDLATLRHARLGPDDPLGRTARLFRGSLLLALQQRTALGLAAAGLLAATAVTAAAGAFAPAALLGALGALAAVAADLLERWWFFTAESSTRMPGGRP